jgi:flagella basal body P-ring formation protein FlgA
MANRRPISATRSAVTGTLALLLTGAALLLPPPVGAAGGVPTERVERRERGLPGSQVLVTLRSESTVRGPEIRLGEIASVEGDDASLVQRLREAEVGRATLPGLSRPLDMSYLKARLRQLPVDPSAVILESPGTVSVTTASQRVEGNDLAAFVREQLAAERGGAAESLAVQVTGPVAPLVLPEGRLELKLRSRPGAELRGTTAHPVEAWVDGTLVRSVSVPVRISLLGEVVVAARPLVRGTILGPEDVRVERRELTNGPEPLRTTREAMDHRATRNIAYGEVIHAGLLELPPLVRRGETVLVSAEGRGVRAVLQAEAREDGRLGQVIRVRNLSSGREVYGRVEADRSIRVAF